MEIPGYELVGESNPGGGYDWSVFAVWFRDGRYFWASDSGCSCYGEWESFDVSNPAFDGSGTRHDAIRALRNWANGSYTAGETEPLLNALLSHKSVSGTVIEGNTAL
jgi:hypothetical protein